MVSNYGDANDTRHQAKEKVIREFLKIHTPTVRGAEVEVLRIPGGFLNMTH